MDHREVGWEGVGWMHLAQDREQLRAVVNTVMKLRVSFLLSFGNWIEVTHDRSNVGIFN